MDHPYAICKVAAERLVTYALRERQTDATAVRLGFVYGPYERPTSSRTAMSSIYEAVALARRGEHIVANGPEIGRDWIHAGDVARGIMLLLDHAGPLSPLYHLGSGRNYSMRETIDAVATRVPGTRVRWTDDPREANVRVAVGNQRGPLSYSRARADVGFVPTLSLRDGLRDYLAFLDSA
jgi:nucleoside-diphosphate-sugar epimerase